MHGRACAPPNCCLEPEAAPTPELPLCGTARSGLPVSWMNRTADPGPARIPTTLGESSQYMARQSRCPAPFACFMRWASRASAGLAPTLQVMRDGAGMDANTARALFTNRLDVLRDYRWSPRSNRLTEAPDAAGGDHSLS
jgi:hypothetical protein